MKKYFVYILKCADDSYYTGFTNNLERRISAHAEGIRPTSFTYKRRPVELVFHQEFSYPNQGIAFEKRIKGWTRLKKEALIKGDFKRLVELSNHNRSHGSTSSP